MGEPKTYVVVMRVQPFEVEQTGPIRLPIPIVVETGKLIGYLPTYENLEDAKADYPEGPYVHIMEMEAPRG